MLQHIFVRLYKYESNRIFLPKLRTVDQILYMDAQREGALARWRYSQLDTHRQGAALYRVELLHAVWLDCNRSAGFANHITIYYSRILIKHPILLHEVHDNKTKLRLTTVLLKVGLHNVFPKVTSPPWLQYILQKYGFTPWADRPLIKKVSNTLRGPYKLLSTFHNWPRKRHRPNDEST